MRTMKDRRDEGLPHGLTNAEGKYVHPWTHFDTNKSVSDKVTEWGSSMFTIALVITVYISAAVSLLWMFYEIMKRSTL